LNISVVAPPAIGPEDRRLWSAAMRSEGIASPFLSWAFVDVIGQVRDDAWVAVVEGDEGPGYFAFQRGPDGSGAPIGAGICDAQAFIAPPPWDFRPQQLFSACGLEAWSFDHMVVEQAPFEPFHRERHRVPVVELASGYQAFDKRIRSHSKDFLPQVLRRRRKLEREIGPMEFEWSTSGVEEAMMVLQEWKSNQYHRTGVWDRFGHPWIVGALNRFAHTRDPDCTGLLSVLRAGEVPVAVHLGLMSRDRLCWWFPAYDPAFARYSPGLILILELISAAADRGVPLLDLGRGEHDYKLRIADRFYEVAEGEWSAGRV